MKINIFKNDKGTIKDEIALSLITITSLVAGILLIVLKPSFLIFDSTIFVSMGVLFVILAVMYIPCIVYRIMTNDVKGTENNNG